MEEFKNYKEKQEFYKQRSRLGRVVHKSKKGDKPFNKREEAIKKMKMQMMFNRRKKKEE